MLLLLWGVVAGATTLALGAHQAKFWTAPDWVIWLCIGVLAIQTFLPLARAGLRRMRGEVTTKFANHTKTTLGAVVLELAKLKIEIDELGVSAFIVHRKMRKPWEPLLRRVARQRLVSAPGPSRILWTKGKGVIGRCWVEENVVVKDTQVVHRPYLEATQAEWEAAPYETRMGLSYDEFQRIKGKYAVCVAVPIMTETSGEVSFRGCIAADIRWGGYTEPLMTTEAVDVLMDAAATVAAELSYLPRWTLW